MSISNDFQNRINDLVEECNVKKSALPKIIGVDYRSLANALNYGIIPTPRLLIRISDYFGVPIKYLLGETDEDYFVKANPKSDFKARLELLCREKQVSFYQVSKDCHFSNSYITRWLNKKYLPSLELLEILCDYFEVSIDYLLGRTNDRK